MSVDQRRLMVKPAHPQLSITAQCRLLSISRSGYYCAPVPEVAPSLALMALLGCAAAKVGMGASVAGWCPVGSGVEPLSARSRPIAIEVWIM